MTKRKILLSAVLSFVCIVSPLTAQNASSDSSLFSELHSAYQSKAYPAVVEYGAQLEAQYPHSLYLGQVLAYKGESLFKLGRFDEAVQTLEQALPLCKDNTALQIQSWYWEGRSLYELQSYDKALVSFNNACVLFKNGTSDNKKTTSFNAHSFLYAGKSYYEKKQFAEAVPLFEYVTANGEQYGTAEYSAAFLQLFTCYLKTDKYSRLVSVYEKLPDNCDLFLADVYDECTLYAGDAYNALGKYKNAYDCYNTVLTGKRPELAAVALQRSYLVSSEHQKDVGRDSGSVLAEAKSTLSEYPELVSEFYIRLGIDAYNAGDMSKASSYFDSGEISALPQYLALIGLYRADMLLRDNGTQNANGQQKTNSQQKANSQQTAIAQQTLTLLDSYAAKATLTEKSALYPVYELTAVRCYALQQNWKEVIARAPSALSDSEKWNANNLYSYDATEARTDTTYYYALALYQTGSYDKAATTINSLPADKRSYNATVLNACIQAKLGNNTQAMQIFSQLDEANKLKEADRLDYAKLLLSNGYISAAYKEAVQVNKPEAWYVTALASFNRKDWLSAEQYFTKYLSSSEKAYYAFAQFYCGYAQYRLGKTPNAYKTLTSFTEAYPAHELAWNAHITAANAAVQNNRYDLAAKEAEEAIRIAKTPELNEQAVVLTANIYADSGKYDKAIETLAQYTKLPTDFGVRCRYQTAQIYAVQGKLNDSDALYGVIAEQFKSNALADDAAYRRGELYYNATSYSTAVLRFDAYRKQYPSGNFTDASYFYEGDSLAHLLQNDRAVLMYLTLINTMPKSSYCYTAKKNLIALYRTQNDYKEALSLAQSLVSEYGDQAKKDNITSQVAELKKLAGGEDEQIVKQRAAYENAGGLTTSEGRVAGTKLAVTLWKSVSTQPEAVSLAERLFPIQTTKQNETKECTYAAQTALILAQNLRQLDKNKEAADKYLSATQYARMSKNDDLASRALYGAVEAFDAAGMTADAKEAEATLEELYPSSDYTTQAKAIVTRN